MHIIVLDINPKNENFHHKSRIRTKTKKP